MISVAQAAERLCCSRKKVRGLLRSGQVRGHKCMGVEASEIVQQSRWLVSRASLDDYLGKATRPVLEEETLGLSPHEGLGYLEPEHRSVP